MSLPAKPFVSVQEAADIIGCSGSRVRQLLIEGTLHGQKLNERAWAVERRSAEAFAKVPQGVGRPRRQAS